MTVLSEMHMGWMLFLRDLKGRYRQTYFGLFWFFCGPVVGALPLIAVGRQFNFGGGASETPYVIFALVGVVLWEVFWRAIFFPQWMMRRMRKVLRTFPVSGTVMLSVSACYILMNTAIQLVFLVAASLFLPQIPSSYFMGFLAIPVLLLSGFSVGIFIAPIALVFHDFRYGLRYVGSLLLLTAPVFYTMPEHGFLRFVNLCNPITYLVGIPREWFVSGFAAHDFFFLASAALFLALLVVGLRFYRHALPIALAQA